MRPIVIAILTSQLLVTTAFAQTDKKPKSKLPLCNPLVLGQIPKKALSLQYDYQLGFTNNFSEQYDRGGLFGRENKVNNVQAVRANFNKNVIVKPKLYMSMDIGYWYSRFAAEPSNPATVFARELNGSTFHSFSATANIFKPLGPRHFILVYLSAELNGNGRSFSKLGAQNLFGGGGVLYGWKKGLNSMKAIGFLRAYRLGRVVHVPALLMNHNFNKKWGVEMLLPARATFRYAPNAKSFILFGYDLEGGQFAFSAPGSPMDNSFFQRGEVRPRLGYEGSLSKNCRFTVNAGLRMNGRFWFADNYDGKNLLVDNLPSSSLFANVGLHIVNLKVTGKNKK